MGSGLDGFLTEKIPDPEVLPEQEGSAIIFKASREGSLHLVKILTAKGLWIKVITPNKENLLHLACKSGELGLIKYLIGRGLDVNSMSEFGTPVLEAANLPFKTIKQRENKNKVLAYLISQGADVNLCEEEFKETPLLRACLVGDFSCVSYLLDNGADISLKGRNETPLTKTVLGCVGSMESEYFKIIDLLLEKGSSLEERDRNGLQAIHKACFRAESGLINFLFEKGVDLDAQIPASDYGYGEDDISCYEGMTPLMFGVLSKEPGIVKLLLGLGSDAEVATPDEIFALDLAEDLNDDDLINALEGDIQLFGDDDGVDIGWTKFEDDEEELKEVEEGPVEEAPEPVELKTEEEESDDFLLHDQDSEVSDKSFNMFDDMAEEDILDDQERKEKEEAKKKEEEDVVIGDIGEEEDPGDLMEDETFIKDDMSIDKDKVEAKTDELGSKSFQMFDDMAEEDLEEEEDDEDPFKPKD
ncbi:MAG: ankyrin repeat domain-containing protein [Bdellovibrionota bacterium]|nr:ankyrin repeat domain-containing protein [Bdellovibrionota bacterium]